MDSEHINSEDEELFEHHHLVVDPGQEPLRIDKFLLDRLPNVTRNKIQDGIKNKFVLVNKATVKANYKVKPKDSIQIMLPKPPRDTEVLPENIPLDIVYEDPSILVVNKPAGMVVHPA